MREGSGKETYAGFLKELVQCWLIVPIQNTVTADPETGVTNLPMLTQKTASGAKILSVFTDDESFAKYKPGAPAVAELRCQDIFTLAIQVKIDHVVLNTGSPLAVAVDKRYFSELSEGQVPVLE